MCYMGTQFREKFFKSQQQKILWKVTRSPTQLRVPFTQLHLRPGVVGTISSCRHETQSKIYTNVSYFQTKAFIIDDSVRLFVHQRIGLIQSVEQRDPVRGLE